MQHCLKHIVCNPAMLILINCTAEFHEQLRSLAGSMDGSQYLGGDIIRVVTLDSPALSLSHCHESWLRQVGWTLWLPSWASAETGERMWPVFGRFLHGDADSWLGLESWWVSNLNVKVNIILNLIWIWIWIWNFTTESQIMSSWVLNLNHTGLDLNCMLLWISAAFDILGQRSWKRSPTTVGLTSGACEISRNDAVT